jgi:putative nucleotidyltransferase with HDIG domain
MPDASATDTGGSRVRYLIAFVCLALLGCLIVAVIQVPDDHLTNLSAVLAFAAVASGLAVSTPTVGTSISGTFIVVILAATFLGPVSACVAWILGELAASYRDRTAVDQVLANVLAGVLPALVCAGLIRAAVPHERGTATFYVAVAGASVVFLILNFAIVFEYQRRRRVDQRWQLHDVIDYLPSLGLNIVLALAGVAIYVKVGLAGIAFALAAVAAFAYMAVLLDRARKRAQQYVSLSWGVLGGLLRALDLRDQRAARHAAAVARFAADIATAVGMTPEERELAHTAGLLHDIGHFALSDRVAERGKQLTDEDWAAIHRHPELGAEMLRDLGMYGPVAEIVRAHHERVDGRGYPNMLAADEIPEIAKIVAVAEVYDTLTASDTYRTRMSSFEALNELRRVAGSQLDAEYVEVLAGLLSGEGVAYRHADDADFDAELAMERRLREAASA